MALRKYALATSTALAVVASMTAVRAADLPVAAPAEVAPAAVATGGFYIGSRSAVTFVEETEVAVTGFSSLEAEYETGFFTGGLIGYDFGTVLGGFGGVRIELEGSYGESSVDTATVFQDGTAIEFDEESSFGEITTYAGFGNLFIDLSFGDTFFKPFIGGGAGVMNVELKKQGVDVIGAFDDFGVGVDDDDTVFAYHGSAGIGIDMGRLGLGNAFQGATLEIGYRYQRADDLEFTSLRDGGVESETDFESHNITVGIRSGF